MDNTILHSQGDRPAGETTVRKRWATICSRSSML